MIDNEESLLKVRRKTKCYNKSEIINISLYGELVFNIIKFPMKILDIQENTLINERKELLINSLSLSILKKLNHIKLFNISNEISRSLLLSLSPKISKRNEVIFYKSTSENDIIIFLIEGKLEVYYKNTSTPDDFIIGPGVSFDIQENLIFENENKDFFNRIIRPPIKLISNNESVYCILSKNNILKLIQDWRSMTKQKDDNILSDYILKNFKDADDIKNSNINKLLSKFEISQLNKRSEDDLLKLIKKKEKLLFIIKGEIELSIKIKNIEMDDVINEIKVKIKNGRRIMEVKREISKSKKNFDDENNLKYRILNDVQFKEENNQDDSAEMKNKKYDIVAKNKSVFNYKLEKFKINKSVELMVNKLKTKVKHNTNENLLKVDMNNHHKLNKEKDSKVKLIISSPDWINIDIFLNNNSLADKIYNVKLVTNNITLRSISLDEFKLSFYNIFQFESQIKLFNIIRIKYLMLINNVFKKRNLKEKDRKQGIQLKKETYTNKLFELNPSIRIKSIMQKHQHVFDQYMNIISSNTSDTVKYLTKQKSSNNIKDYKLRESISTQKVKINETLKRNIKTKAKYFINNKNPTSFSSFKEMISNIKNSNSNKSKSLNFSSFNHNFSCSNTQNDTKKKKNSVESQNIENKLENEKTITRKISVIDDNEYKIINREYQLYSKTNSIRLMKEYKK